MLNKFFFFLFKDDLTVLNKRIVSWSLSRSFTANLVITTSHKPVSSTPDLRAADSHVCLKASKSDISSSFSFSVCSSISAWPI